MNQSIGYCVSLPIHFKQWSNRSYAIFNSIGRIVHIGFLATIIHGLETVKANGIHGIFMLLNTFHEDPDHELLLQTSDLMLVLNREEEFIYATYLNSNPFSRNFDSIFAYVNNYRFQRPFLGLFFICRDDTFYEKSGIFFIPIQN